MFDDPDINNAFETNEILFCKMMYSYLQNSISLFDNPSKIAFRLSNYTEPIGKTEIFEADGINKDFVSEMIFRDDSKKIYMEDNVIVQGDYDQNTKIVSFNNVLNLGQQYFFERYFVGCFNEDFLDISNSSDGQQFIINRIKDILARLLIKSWAEETRNFLLDIKNLLSDSDFKVHPNSSVLRSKNEWVAQMDKELAELQNRLSWVIRFANSGRNK